MNMKQGICLLGMGALVLTALPSARAVSIGVNPPYPMVEFDNITQNSIQYNPTTGTFTLSATPYGIVFSKNEPGTFIDSPNSLSITFKVDQNGNLVSGSGTGGFNLQGAFDGAINGAPVNDSGVLLSGNVEKFGWQVTPSFLENVGYFDFDFSITGGLLANYFNGADAFVYSSTTFTGSFDTSFDGLSKGEVGLTYAGVPDGAPTGGLLGGVLLGLGLLRRKGVV